MPASSLMDARLAALRAEVGAIERSGFAAAAGAALPFGIGEVDGRLAGGGLRRALHEAAAASLAPGDDAAATLFLAAAAARFALAQNGARCCGRSPGAICSRPASLWRGWRRSG